MEVIARCLDERGFLPVPWEGSLESNGQYHRRQMAHGTPHHLGLDVHDYAQARREMHTGVKLEPGMIFTTEPGLYSRKDDPAVPEEYRGILMYVEDDILVREDGSRERLSEEIAHDTDAMEAWVWGSLGQIGLVGRARFRGLVRRQGAHFMNWPLSRQHGLVDKLL